ncbi:toxin HipA [Cellulomonas chitinilytica]|uniref:Toxin HipA n=1 Tax=Cellulomonas chitinilytica TaxID=398759 RepID=A0A919NZW6_9CELL|nr:type II toxin-antitoxin system HipA family toxin [Cellulomonas chitinilytica]GIG20771.1 toxin HipA [Cellulomonas chitinilytica]
MSDVLYVLLDGHVAATIRRERGDVELQYTPEHIRRRTRTPLSVSMPVTSQTYRNTTVAPWLDGLLPDDDAVRRRWGRRFSVSAGSPFSLLSTPIGEECAGAARFVTAERVDAMLAGKGDVRWLTEDEVGARLRELLADSSAWLGADFSGRFSLAGAQSKVAMVYDDNADRWGLPEGAAATSHILKPAISGLEDHDLNEHLCLRAAAACGLVTAPSRIVRFAGTSAIAVTRYDRAAGEPWLRRIHQEDMCQASSLHPASKYQNDGGPGSKDVATLLRAVLPASQAEAGVWRLFDAVTFSWLIGGTDAHAKNDSLLLAGNQVALAPLYDVASVLPYGWTLQKLRLAMKYGGDYTLRTRTATIWPKVAAEFSLPVEQVRSRAGALMDVVPDAFAEAAADPDVKALGSVLPTTLASKVAERVTQCRETLA